MHPERKIFSSYVIKLSIAFIKRTDDFPDDFLDQSDLEHNFKIFVPIMFFTTEFVVTILLHTAK